MSNRFLPELDDLRRRASVFWYRGFAGANPPITAALVTGKTVCEDPLVARADETNDCDGDIDALDSDCSTCLPDGSWCSTDDQCCSDNCSGWWIFKRCR